jgi:hypothetical protein
MIKAKNIFPFILSTLLPFSLKAELSFNEKHSLLADFAPLLKMHKDDESSPTSIEWYVERCSLWFRQKHNDVFDKAEIIPAGHIRADDLYALRTQPVPNDEQAYYLQPYSKQVYKGEGYSNKQAKGTCYGNVVEKENGDVVVQYLFFYAYQGSLAGVHIPGLDTFFHLLDIGIHEGDWEHIDVHLKKTANGYQMETIFYGRHQENKGDLLPASAVERVNDAGEVDANGTHPVVYVAKNSHANYPRVVNITGDFDRTADGGPVWKCWEHVVYLGTEDAPTEAMKMLMANIRWGSTIENSSHTHGNSPTSPLDSSWFRRPGIDRAPIKMFDRKGTRLYKPITVSSDPLPSGNRRRHSNYFTLQPPKRLQKLEWHIEHPQADQIVFDVWRRSTTLGVKRSDTKIFSGLKHGSQTLIPDTMQDLYIANVRFLAEDTQRAAPEFNVSVKGVEL